MQPSDHFRALSSKLADGGKNAIAELEDLAATGDPFACLTLGEFRLVGIHGRRDLVEGYRLISLAADQGLPDALRGRAYLTAQGRGCPADFATARQMLEDIAASDRLAAVQLKMLDFVTPLEETRTARRTVVSEDPRIEVVHQLISPQECHYLRIVKEPAMATAVVAKGRVDPYRDSDCSAFGPLSEDLVVNCINRCIAVATGTETSWGEPLAILRYRPGQQYRPHHDAIRPGDLRDERQMTALVWLNEEYEGGETRFPELGVTVRGVTGDMILFRNVTDDLQMDPRMVHAGLPVTSGIKWLATRWIHSRDSLAEEEGAGLRVAG